jgi:hypothetical protein
VSYVKEIISLIEDKGPFHGNDQIRDWAKEQIGRSASRTDWKKLPSSFEHDAVKRVFSQVKGHINKKAIRHRINASRATTHDELRSALDLGEARYPHRIPKVAASPTDTNLDFTWGSDGMKKKRKKPMTRLINPNGQYLR